jgi:hypothetical protein
LNNFILLNAGIMPLFLFYLLLNIYLYMHVNIHTAITIRRDTSPFYTYSSSHLDSVAWTNYLGRLQSKMSSSKKLKLTCKGTLRQVF